MCLTCFDMNSENFSEQVARIIQWYKAIMYVMRHTIHVICRSRKYSSGINECLRFCFKIWICIILKCFEKLSQPPIKFTNHDATQVLNKSLFTRLPVLLTAFTVLKKMMKRITEMQDCSLPFFSYVWWKCLKPPGLHSSFCFCKINPARNCNQHICKYCAFI